MMPRLIDTHAHLDSDIYARELDHIVKRAHDDGIWIVTIGNDYESSVRAVALAERYPEGVYAAIGLHPSKVDDNAFAEDKLVDFELFRKLAAHPKVVALGETGLDYADVAEEPRIAVAHQEAMRIKHNQRTAFGAFLQLSREFRLPLMLHCREAHEEMLGMLEDWSEASVGFDARGIVHCFSGTWQQARRYYNLDFGISFTGTMAHGAYQVDILKKSPESRIAVESDCPFLTAMPWGIRRSEPAYLDIVARSVAALRGVAPEVLARTTTENVLRMLKRIKV